MPLFVLVSEVFLIENILYVVFVVGLLERYDAEKGFFLLFNKVLLLSLEAINIFSIFLLKI